MKDSGMDRGRGRPTDGGADGWEDGGSHGQTDGYEWRSGWMEERRLGRTDDLRIRMRGPSAPSASFRLVISKNDRKK